MKKRIPQSTLNELKLAYASGASLRELARRTGIPEGTVLSRAKREGWSASIRSARDIVPADPAPTVFNAVNQSLAEHKEAFQANTARALTNASRHAASLAPADALERSRKIAAIVQAGAKLHGLGQPETQVAVHVLNQTFEW